MRSLIIEDEKKTETKSSARSPPSVDLQVTISGVTTCSGCINLGGSLSGNNLTGNLNGTFPLHLVFDNGDVTSWNTRSDGPVFDYDYYSTPDCSGDAAHVSNDRVLLSLTCHRVASYIRFGAVFFFSMFTPANHPPGTLLFPNPNTSCDGTVGASGGTATIIVPPADRR